MADHSQKWHDRTTSKNIIISSSKDGLDALVGCQICEGPHLDKDCPINEEVKQVEETDNRPPYGERGQSLEELLLSIKRNLLGEVPKMEVED
ncbi:hypothetical protein Tco_1403270 [Tanacetum coccineum]